jgi:hypothetical protein
VANEWVSIMYSMFLFEEGKGNREGGEVVG